MDRYIPPFDISDEMIEVSSEIMENLGRLGDLSELERLPRLRRVNRIKSIQSSLAIENNTLSVEQVTDVIEGKRVLGPRDDVLAVQDAFEAYKGLADYDAFSLSDLLRAHGTMMRGLVERAGELRGGSVGVVSADGRVIHVAPPHDLVPQLMQQLFDWLRTSRTPMLIKSCVFHYEFEFIHPFGDGNGRMGRLWQTVLLASWKPIFEWIPIESIIKDNQEEYYRAIGASTAEGKSDEFIMFMLRVIRQAVEELAGDTRNHQRHISGRIEALMAVIEVYPQSAAELMQKLGMKSRQTFRKNYLQPALDAGLIAMTDPDLPTNRNQRYYKV